MALVPSSEEITAEAPAPDKGQRRALMICNTCFSGCSVLPGVAQDAKTLAKVLSDPETCQFSVTTLVDQGFLAVRREIARICRESSEGDTLLIYYSGNGMRGEDGSLYLVVADTEQEYLYATSLDAEFILGELRRSSCRRIVVLIDTCHSGSFFENNRGIPNGLLAITSCGADETSADTPEGGAFTVAVCAGLKNAAADNDGDGRISLDELYDFVRARLEQRGGFGTPQKWVWNVPEPIYLTNAFRHVFVSYAREDLEEARYLAKALEAEGFPVWLDLEGILSGSWKERVMQSLRRTRAVVMLLTPSSLRSEAVKKELDFASRTKIPIIPVQVATVEFADDGDWFTWDYSDLHRHEIAKEHYEDGIKRLAKAIRSARRYPDEKAKEGQTAESDDAG